MKIHVIFTGGTIGSKASNGWVNTDESCSYKILESLREVYKEVHFLPHTLMNELSENFTYSHWNTIVSYLNSINPSDFDGIIITHGSDTLVYTSAVLGMIFSHIKIPIVLTAANYPLENKNSNGLCNFKNAVDFIKSSCLSGVYVSYSNQINDGTIYLSTRMMEPDNYNDNFLPFGAQAIGKIVDSRFTLTQHPSLPDQNDLILHKGNHLEDGFQLTKDVLFIRHYPNQNYSFFDLSRHPSAILIYLYHSGTGCTAGESTSVLGFIEQCKTFGIPVFLASFKKDVAQYLSAKDFFVNGAYLMYNISPAAAYAKACIAVNQNSIPIDYFIKQTLYFEILP